MVKRFVTTNDKGEIVYNGKGEYDARCAGRTGKKFSGIMYSTQESDGIVTLTVDYLGLDSSRAPRIEIRLERNALDSLLEGSGKK
ncbi:MAG: hypothetical protein NTW17_03460 [Candidatus Pacearchaeota archaeon]|nr:hypothetical protein [Candidatus Pacearchaeota archaeon]